MPFKSTAQLRKFYALKKEGKMKQETIDEWTKATPDIAQLPEKAPVSTKIPSSPLAQVRGPRRARRVRG